MANESPGTTHYRFIDGLRGLAALMVVLFHARAGHHVTSLSALLPAGVRWVFEHGNSGVFVFFVISGFVIANALIPQQVTPRAAGFFLLRRTVRLDPPYWASILLVVMFAALSAKFVGGAMFSPPSARDLMLHAAYLPGLMQTDFIADTYWTLCVEIQFYLAFALLMVLVTRLAERMDKERALDFVLWPSVLLANLWALEAAPFQTPGLFFGHWHLFLSGVLVWRAVTRATLGDYVPTVAAVFDLAVLSGAAIHSESIPLAVGTLTGAVVLAVGLLGKLRSWLSARPFQLLGAISYSLYLVHNPLSGAGFRLGYMFTGRGTPWLEAFWLIIVTCACIAGAWVFYKTIEAPSLAFAQRIGSLELTSHGSFADSTRAEPREGTA
ncbi:MAG: acyltransferase [Myxococcales bacterium]